MKARTFIILFLAAMIVGPGSGAFAEPAAVNAKSFFKEGNDLYEKGDYRAAIEEYEKILGMGYDSGPLYYNLGNSYFKDGQPGKAILNYKRAERLMPRDKELKRSHKHVLSIAEGIAPRKPKIFIVCLAYAAGRYFTANELAIFLFGASLLFMAIVLAHIYFYLVKRHFVLILTVLSIFIIASGYLAINKQGGYGKEAVVVSKAADAKFEPFERATTHFTLDEGSTVRITDSKDGWRKIKRPDGKSGWVEKSVLEVI